MTHLIGFAMLLTVLTSQQQNLPDALNDDEIIAIVDLK